MNFKIFSFLVIVIILCSCQEESDFLSDCKCYKKDFKRGIKVTDNLDRYQIVVPNENWNPTTVTDELGNGIDAAILEGKSYKYFGVNEIKKDNDWESLKKQQAEYKSDTNVIESGFININGQESLWNLVDYNTDSIPKLTLYVTTEHPIENSFYTLNLSVSKNKYGKKELCELENLLKLFNTK